MKCSAGGKDIDFLIKILFFWVLHIHYSLLFLGVKTKCTYKSLCTVLLQGMQKTDN